MTAAAAAGLDVVALTDHDSFSGWHEAASTAVDAGIEFVPGVEVSCRHDGISIHLLAYWPNTEDPSFGEMLALTRGARVSRAQRIVELIGRDYPLTWADVTEQAVGAATVGRPHIADAMVARGILPTRDAAFAEVLAGNSRYYVPHYAPEVMDAIATVRSVGGVSVFAHPGADARGRVVADRVIEEMASAGLVGLEVDHRDHSPQQRERLAELGAQLGLVRTGASDYHGTGKLNQLGENLTTPEAFAALRAARG